MAISKEKEQEFENLLKEKLHEQYIQGLRVGSLTISKAVMDKLNDSSKPLMDRIAEVKRICNVRVANEKSKEKETTTNE